MPENTPSTQSPASQGAPVQDQPQSVPVPSAAPAPATFQQPLNEAYADLDRMIESVESSPAGEPEAKAKAEPDAGSPASKPAEKTEKKAAEEKADGAVNKDESLKKSESGTELPPKVKAAELRNAYESLKAKHRALEAELAKLRDQPAKPDPEAEAMKKRLDELQTELKYHRYESSDEYKQRYEQPFIDAYQQGRAKAASLRVTDEEGNVRQGTPEDFDRIARMTDDDAAAELAAEMFGTRASLVLYHRERVHEINSARVRAIEEFRKLGAERQKQMEQEQSRRMEEIGRLWKQANLEAQEKYPQWFKPADGADDENAVLRAGYEMADRGFSDDPSLSPEQRVALHSAIRNRAAAFGRVVLQNKKLSAKVAELEKELGQFKSSEPKSGEGKGKQKAEAQDTLDSVIGSLDSLAH